MNITFHIVTPQSYSDLIIMERKKTYFVFMLMLIIVFNVINLYGDAMSNKDKKELYNKLSPESYHVAVNCGTEPPFSGKYLYNKEKGTYSCIVCGIPLFSSETKYDSGSGWPSFTDVLKSDNIKTEMDIRYGMRRTEVKCARCDAHLGHVFNDGPGKTGLRYCINSVSLDFNKTENK